MSTVTAPPTAVPTQRKPPTGAWYRLGWFLVSHARAVLAIALVGLIASAVLGVGAFGRLLSGGFNDPSSASSKATSLLDQKFGGQPNMIFLVHARTGNVDSPAATHSGEALAA